MDALLKLEERMGVEISDYALLGIALTHRSYLNENDEVTEDNERLEFLGDAVIDLIVRESVMLHATFRFVPQMSVRENAGAVPDVRSARLP